MDSNHRLDVPVEPSGDFRIYEELLGRYILVVVRGEEVLHTEEVVFDAQMQPDLESKAETASHSVSIARRSQDIDGFDTIVASMQTPRDIVKVLSVATVLLMPVLASAQWLNYPTPGVPKKADGTPNLDAPTPRTADGKPDLSGLWLLEKNLPCPKDGCPDMEISREFINLGWNVPGGVPYQPWAAALVKARREQNGKDDPGANCHPTGIVKETINPFFRKLIQLPGLLVILMERDTVYRQIFTDGRPKLVDPLPTPNGYSLGKWDGDTLVVETTGFIDGEWLDRSGNPLTDAGKIIERYHRINYGLMELEITVDDPKAYTKPWTAKVKEFIQPNTELMDYFCLENEKSISHAVGK